MKYEQTIIDAFKSSEIERIVMIDDAYDPPNINQRKLVTFLENADNHTALHDCAVEKHTIKEAIDSASDSEVSEQLDFIHRSLYQKFVDTAEKRFDPSGLFEKRRGVDLAFLRPFFALLGKSVGQDNVRTAGRYDGRECCRKFCPQVLFIDYFLGPNTPHEGGESENNEGPNPRLSLDLIQKITDDAREKGIPALVLMSSYAVGEKGNGYRTQAGYMSLRFQFLPKESVRQNGEDIVIESSVAGALSSWILGYKFGKALQQSMDEWKKGAKKAIEDLLNDLDVKDFAYLLHFRLRDEGQPLSEYLKWFLGECLIGRIANEVDWTHASFSKLDGQREQSIRGAFDGLSRNIANLFHLIKVDGHRACENRDYRLGDFYEEYNGNRIRAVITPDCDLVSRNGKTNAKNVLTMGGTLNIFGEEEFSADNLFLLKESIKSVKWKPKDLMTFPLDGGDSLRAKRKFSFLGTLRPLYAQEMQRLALTDLSRIGLPVSPLAINAEVTVSWMCSNGKSRELKLAGHTKQGFSDPATITLPRKKEDKYHLVLFRHYFIYALIDKLDNEINQVLTNECRASELIKDLKEGGKKIRKELIEEGVRIKKLKSILGIIHISLDEKQSLKTGLNIVLTPSAGDAEFPDENKGS